jgi:hypothetical protein
MLGRLDRHAADRRLCGGHADRLGIVAAVLAALDKRLDILRRDQSHAVAKRQQRAPPVMRAATGFQRHLDRRQPFKEGQQRTPPQIAPMAMARRVISVMDGRQFVSLTAGCRGALHPNGKPRRKPGGIPPTRCEPS